MFRFDPKDVEMWLYDEIGPPGSGAIDAGSVVDAVSKMPKNKRLTVRINSPGGSVDQGIAIYNALARHPGGVTTINDSLAASISSLIFMAGSERIVAENSLSMIHQPWTIAAGSATDLRQMASLLDKAQETIEQAYVSKTGQDQEAIAALMAAETWFSAAESLEAGISTRVGERADVEPMRVAANWFKHAPAAILKPSKVGSNRIWCPQLQKYKRLAATV